MRLNFDIMPKKMVDSISAVQLQQWTCDGRRSAEDDPLVIIEIAV